MLLRAVGGFVRVERGLLVVEVVCRVSDGSFRSLWLLLSV